MWYEILPSFGIICAALSLPPFGSYLINKVVLGNGYRRSMLTLENRMSYIRDSRISGGSAYKVAGLENLPPK